MRVTNILSSHYPGSFTSVLCQTFNEELERRGHQQTTVDLYQQSFNPVMQGGDFNQFFEKPLPEEIIEFHELLRRTDLLAFFYPIWWNDMPAIMKGWIDRVFAKGFAYEVYPEGTKGILPVNKAFLFCTLGNKKEDIHPKLEDAMRVKERHGVLGYCGIQDVEHYFFYNVDAKDTRAACLDRVRLLAEKL